jgi:hypothetical protein
MALFLGAAPASQNVSLGEFAVMLANRMADGDDARTPMTAEAASKALEKAGIKLRGDLASPATEEDAVQAFRQFGITLQSRSGVAPLLRQQAESLIGVFGSSLAAKAAPTAPIKVSGGREIVTTPIPGLESISDCQALPKTQDCQQCCRDLFGAGQNDVHSNRICGKACNSKSRDVSASEPTP